MNQSQHNDVMDIELLLYQGMRYNPDLVAAIAEALDKSQPVFKRADAPDRSRVQAIMTQFCEAGSHTLSNLAGSSKPYEEIVVDVGKHLKVDEVDSARRVDQNEHAIIQKMFADMWNELGEEDRRKLLEGMDIGGNIDAALLAKGGVIAGQVAGRLAGFGVYKLAVVVANTVARQLLGRGLGLAANAALMRGVSVVLGPIGWIVSGLWLAHDLMGPALRKTTPAVVLIAALRLTLREHAGVGLVGPGSAGKDCAMRELFGVDTGEIDALAGSTSTAQIYELELDGGQAHDYRVINFPGFDDIRRSVDEETRNLLSLCRSFVIVIDATSGSSRRETDLVDRVREQDRPFLIALNKWDQVREKDRDRVYAAALERFGVSEDRLVRTSFDPDERLGEERRGIEEVRAWISESLDWRALGRSRESEV